MKKLLLSVMLLVFSAASYAGPCATRYEDNVLANDGCQLGSTNNDSTAQVNADSMFGYTDWTQVWKSDSGATKPDGLTDFTMAGDLLSGTFQIDWADNTGGQVLFVLKDGQDDPWQYVGWLLDPGTFGLQDYSYDTPFLNTNTGNLKQISHASFYYRAGGPTVQCENCSNVPVAATMPLFGIGALALLWSRRRKS